MAEKSTTMYRFVSDQFSSDDAMLVERLGVKIKLVMGNYNNIKITTKEDIVIAEAIVEDLDE